MHALLIAALLGSPFLVPPPSGGIALDGTAKLNLDLAGYYITDSTGVAQLCGAGTTSHSLGTGDGICNGKLEVDGTLYGDGWIMGGVGFLPGGNVVDNGGLRYRAGDGLVLFLGENGALRHLIITTSTNWDRDHDHDTLSANPTVFLNSATNPDTANDEFSQWDWRSIKLGGAGGGLGCINETFAYTDMTDLGAAVGIFDFTESIPDGAVVQQAILHTLEGFAGDVSAVITLGDGADVDRYNTGTPSVFTTNASGVALGVPSGTAWHDAAASVRATITTNADFTSVSAGQATVVICYWTP